MALAISDAEKTPNRKYALRLINYSDSLNYMQDKSIH